MSLTSRLHALFCASLLLLLAAVPAAAEETPWYVVEIIVFASAKGAYANSESWSQDLPQPQFASARTIGNPPFKAVDPNNYRMQGEWSRLQSSADYRPLLHTAWMQQGFARDKAVGVLIEAGAPTPALGDEKPLSGVISVGLSRYLHLDANLLYRRALTPSSNGAPAFQTYQLSETRRMRSREIHYLDHPMFGVMALITPIAGSGSR